MTQGLFAILDNRQLTGNVYRMILAGDTGAITKPGQFVNVKIEGQYLRRPISVCDWEIGILTLIYKVVGEGTAKMATMEAGETLDLLVGLGNGFDTSKSGDAPLLLGGGVGVPPMYGLCKRLLDEGKKVTVVLGFNTKDEVFYENHFRRLGCEVIVTTVDGSHGEKGFVTDAMKNLTYSYFYTCGPMPMFKAIEATAVTSGQFSFEEGMGCGFGSCMGCS
jgi:dihydroorotate dehydrogenase electron transfer subunit